MNSIEAAKIYGMNRSVQQSKVESLMEKDGAEAIGLSYYIKTEDKTIAIVDPWGRVTWLKRDEEEVIDEEHTSNT